MFEKNDKGKIRLIDKKGNDVFFDYPVDAREALSTTDEDGISCYTNPFKESEKPKKIKQQEKEETKKEESPVKIQPQMELKKQMPTPEDMESFPKKRGRKTKEELDSIEEQKEISESEIEENEPKIED